MAGLSVKEAAQVLGVHLRTVYRYENGETIPNALGIRRMTELANVHARKSRKTKFQFIDLFAGIGGLRRPFEEIGGECVFTAEWDSNCRKTYAANFSTDHLMAGDIREYSERPQDIPEHDVLLAGFPCQPFSLAGVSKKNALGRPHGFLCETQGTLFFDLARILEYHRPKAFLLENVKNLERHDGGRTFATIMNVLENELRYNVRYRVINSRSWVPQKRERIFIVGFRDDTRFEFDTMEIPDPDKGPRLGSILQEPEEVDDKYILTPKLWAYLKEYKKKHQSKGNGFGFSLFGPDDVTRTLSARYYKDGSEVLISRGSKRPRRLTPRECARLMGFDRPGYPEFEIPVSDTQAYKQFGNAVVMPVVQAIAQHMQSYLAEALLRDGVQIDLPIFSEEVAGHG
ncbi:MAG: DNA (cytosine-5-)-methyltransferase [Rhodospirillales bacterium]|nr:DNA (cytosine-5-)-methyltransferase [Alphaproteobacteria bacterium]MCB9976767.1 DNA (cytosine-5-)-methyltransferase [Rhodospirillales bacterium]